MTRIAFISDLHIGPTEYHDGVRRKLTEHAESYLNEFIDFISQAGNIAFAIQLGDLIQDAELETDRTHFKKAVDILSSGPSPVHHAIGNHDSVNLSFEEIQNILGLGSLYYSFDEGLYHFIVLHTLGPGPETPAVILPDDQMGWLQKNLAGTEKPTFVFSHHSFADQDLTGNPWFEALPEECLVGNREEVRKVFRESGKVAAVINGHLHWNHVDWHEGIPYITVQSAVENVDNNGTPARAWGMMEIRGESFTLIQHGNDPFKHQHEFSVKAG
jgi:3',5'-cyclic-AMP phosphodiesterase